MVNNAWTIFRISAAMRGNKIIFWLGRIPLIKRLVSDTLYNAAEGKLALTGVLWAWRALRAVLGKFIYVGLACVAPVALMVDTWQEVGTGFGVFCWLLLMLSFVTGTLVQPKAVEPSQLKYTCVRMMSMDARTYQLLVGTGNHVSMFITFTPALMTAAALMGQGAWSGLILSVELACARLIGEWLHVWLYDRTEKLPGNNALFTVFLAMGGLCAAYIPAIIISEEGLLEVFKPQSILLHPACVIVMVALGIFCGALLFRYQNYFRLMMDTCKPEKVSAEAAQKKNAAAQFSDVRLKDSDLTAEGESAKTGWPYLQDLFFRRHRRMLYKPVKVVLICIGAVTVVLGGILLFFRGGEVGELFSRITLVLPFCVFFLYIIQSNVIGNRICKAMFYNCDLAMLKYGWYREPKVVLKNFVLRFRRLCGVNLALSGAVCLMFTLLVVCAGGRPDPVQYLAFLAAILCLGVFFAVHCLGMYYLFQPYTSDLQVKNPFFGIINWVMYMVCYMCIQIRSTPAWFTPVVLAVTVVYSAVILLAVWRRAPKSFRVK